MFYLETKDGDRFFTDANSDDKLEFEKILESKLGKDAATMFDSLVAEVKLINDDILERVYYRLSDAVDDLDKALDKTDLDRNRLDDILSELQSILTSIN